jgi:hypothetical protein
VANAVIWLESSDQKKSLTPDAATWTISIIPLRAPAAPKIAEDIQESARGTSLGGLMPRLLDVSFERELSQLVWASLRSIGQYLRRKGGPFIAAAHERNSRRPKKAVIWSPSCRKVAEPTIAQSDGASSRNIRETTAVASVYVCFRTISAHRNSVFPMRLVRRLKPIAHRSATAAAVSRMMRWCGPTQLQPRRR